jgi:hypothetical protein
VSAGVRTRTEDTPQFLKGTSPNLMGLRSIVDALGGANPTRLRPGADCAVQGRKTQKRPTRLFGGFLPPGCRSVTGNGCKKPNRRATLEDWQMPRGMGGEPDELAGLKALCLTMANALGKAVA